MPDHDLAVIIALVIMFVTAVIGFTIMGRMLRECQRLTRAVAGLVVQETEKIRTLMSAR